MDSGAERRFQCSDCHGWHHNNAAGREECRVALLVRCRTLAQAIGDNARIHAEDVQRLTEERDEWAQEANYANLRTVEQREKAESERDKALSWFEGALAERDYWRAHYEQAHKDFDDVVGITQERIQERDAARAALAELVRLKDLKDKITKDSPHYDSGDGLIVFGKPREHPMYADYQEDRKSAWETARRLVREPPANPVTDWQETSGTTTNREWYAGKDGESAC